MTGPKVAFFDIETAPTRGWVWKNYEDNLIGTDKDWYMLSFAVKWAHQKKVQIYALPDYPQYKRDKECDRALVKDLWRIMNEADIVVAHNGDAFDIKKSNARFIANGLQPPAPYKSIDTLKIARRHFKFSSNRLNDLGVALGLGKKLPHTGSHLWFGCMSGDPKSWAVMRRYNIQDVRLLERVYYKIRPWATSHPNMTLYRAFRDRPPGIPCPTCESTNTQRRGVQVKVNTRRHRFHCQECGSWFSGKPV